MSRRTAKRWRRERGRAPPHVIPPAIENVAGGVGGGAKTDTEPEGLAARALANFWNAGDRVELIAAMRAIVLDNSKKPRERTAAFRALVMASRAEVSAIKAAIEAEDHEQYVEEFAALEARLEQSKSKSTSTSR